MATNAPTNLSPSKRRGIALPIIDWLLIYSIFFDDISCDKRWCCTYGTVRSRWIREVRPNSDISYTLYFHAFLISYSGILHRTWTQLFDELWQVIDTWTWLRIYSRKLVIRIANALCCSHREIICEYGCNFRYWSTWHRLPGMWGHDCIYVTGGQETVNGPVSWQVQSRVREIQEKVMHKIVAVFLNVPSWYQGN